MLTQETTGARIFDPALAGTAEERWDAFLGAAPDWIPLARPMLVVSPHPDDEVFGAGGLIRFQACAGISVTVLSVTEGEAAFPDWDGLGGIRRRELDTALGVLTDHAVARVRLGIPDGEVAEHTTQLAEALGQFVQSRPVLVAPYEHDGHPDHDATGAICCEIARRHHLALVRYPIWTWHHSTPEALDSQTWGRLVLDPPAQAAKASAIECFASQLRPRGRQAIVPPHVLAYFRRPFEAFLL